MFPVLAVNFIGTLGFSVVIPFLVFVVADFGGNPVVYGLIGATYPALQLIGAPVLGRWSDQVGRRRVLLVSQGGTLLAWLIFLTAFFVPKTVLLSLQSPLLGSFTLTVPLLVVFFARALDGLTGGNIAVANAYVADLSDDATRSRNFGRMGVSSNLGFVMGPALASVLGWIGMDYTVPVMACIGISFVATLMIAFFLPDSRPCTLTSSPNPKALRRVFGQGQRDCIDASRPRTKTTWEIWQRPGLGPLLLLYFLVFLAFNVFYTAFPSHAVLALDWEVSDTGMFFSFLSLAMVIVQGPLLERLSKVFNSTTLIVTGNLILATFFLTLTVGTSAATYVAAALFALGNGLMWPSVLARLAQLAGPADQGTVQGIAGSLGSAASIVGLIGGGLLYNWQGGTTFVLSAVIICAATLLLLPQRRPTPSPQASAPG